MPKMSKFFRILAPVLVLAGGVGMVVLLHATKPEPEKTDEAPRPISLFVDRVERTDLVLSVHAQGEVRPKVEIDLVPQVSGRIVYVSDSFVEGGSVKAGEILIRIEDRDYRIAVTQAAAQVAEAELQLALREADAEVARNQWDEDVAGPATPLALKEPQVLNARARLASAEADLERAQLNLERTNITVPFDGHVLKKTAGLGQFVTTGALLGRVYSAKSVEVRLPLTDTQLATLGLPIAYKAADGDPIGVTFSAIVAGEMRHWQGRIVRTYASVDSTTRMIYAAAEVEDPYGAGADGDVPMAVGLFVNAEIEGQAITAAHVVPREALRGANNIYVVSDDGILSIRTVHVLYSDEDKAVIANGITAGELVVISSVRAPYDGMIVEAIERGPTQTVANNHN